MYSNLSTMCHKNQPFKFINHQYVLEAYFRICIVRYLGEKVILNNSQTRNSLNQLFSSHFNI